MLDFPSAMLNILSEIKEYQKTFYLRNKSNLQDVEPINIINTENIKIVDDNSLKYHEGIITKAGGFSALKKNYNS